MGSLLLRKTEVAIFQMKTCKRPPAQPHSSNPNMEMWSKLPVKKGQARWPPRADLSLFHQTWRESVVWMHTQHYRSSGAATALLGQILEGFMQIGKLLKAGLTSKGLTFCHSYMFLLFLHNLSLGTATSLSCTHSVMHVRDTNVHTDISKHTPALRDSSKTSLAHSCLVHFVSPANGLMGWGLVLCPHTFHLPAPHISTPNYDPLGGAQPA